MLQLENSGDKLIASNGTSTVEPYGTDGLVHFERCDKVRQLMTIDRIFDQKLSAGYHTVNLYIYSYDWPMTTVLVDSGNFYASYIVVREYY